MAYFWKPPRRREFKSHHFRIFSGDDCCFAWFKTRPCPASSMGEHLSYKQVTVVRFHRWVRQKILDLGLGTEALSAMQRTLNPTSRVRFLAVLRRKVVSGGRSTGLESRTCFTAEGSTPSPSSGDSNPLRPRISSPSTAACLRLGSSFASLDSVARLVGSRCRARWLEVDRFDSFTFLCGA